VAAQAQAIQTRPLTTFSSSKPLHEASRTLPCLARLSWICARNTPSANGVILDDPVHLPSTRCFSRCVAAMPIGHSISSKMRLLSSILVPGVGLRWSHAALSATPSTSRRWRPLSAAVCLEVPGQGQATRVGEPEWMPVVAASARGHEMRVALDTAGAMTQRQVLKMDVSWMEQPACHICAWSSLTMLPNVAF
jgi:hypothetical protein